MIETIWDLTSQQLPKLANNQNPTTKPLQTHNGTNTSLRTKLPNMFCKSLLSPTHLLTKCWQHWTWSCKSVQRWTLSFLELPDKIKKSWISILLNLSTHFWQMYLYKDKNEDSMWSYSVSSSDVTSEDTKRRRIWVHPLTGNNILLCKTLPQSSCLGRRCWYMQISLFFFNLITSLLGPSHPPKGPSLTSAVGQLTTLHAFEPSCRLFCKNKVGDVEKRFPGAWMVVVTTAE